MLVVLILVVMLLRRLAIDGSHLTRLLIASAREYIADAEAVRLTQNPAALVSALRRIEGRSFIPGLAAGQDAMMIDGAHEGALATHPTIGERIAAIISVTGSLALIAPGRRDTRSSELRGREGFGRRLPLGIDAAILGGARGRKGDALTRVSSGGGDFNRLGLTPEMSVGAVAAIGVFLWVNSAALSNPSALAKALDPSSIRTLFSLAGEGARCQVQGVGSLFGMVAKPTGCDVDQMLAPFREKEGLIGKLAAGMSEPPEGMHKWPDGTFRSAAPPSVQPCRSPASSLLPDGPVLSRRTAVCTL
jgi:hypothetical protein